LTKTKFPRQPEWHQARGLLVEIAYAFKLRGAFEPAVEVVGPAVIRAAQDRAGPLGLHGDLGGVVATNIEERAEDAVLAADDDDGLSGDSRREELARRLHLRGATGKVPVAGEDRVSLEGIHARVDVPGRGDGEGPREIGGGVIGADDVGDRLGQGCSLLLR
jgi:hypothetical protein